MKKITLGLDLGVASIGWALVEEDNANGRILDAGVRVFEAGGLDTPDGEKTPWESIRKSRGVARRARRRLARRGDRKKKLIEILERNSLCPSIERRTAWNDLDPYELRSEALDRQLTLEEFGRALYHICQRRGYKSNAYEEVAPDETKKKKKNDDDESKLKEARRLLTKEIANSGLTLGQYLHAKKDKHALNMGQQVLRNRKFSTEHLALPRATERKMYLDEFNRIWKIQADHHPSVLTDTLRDEIGDAIFRQLDFRLPEKLQQRRVGRCIVDEDKPRCPADDWHAQQFRIWKEINNLRIPPAKGESEGPLTKAQRDKAVAFLMTSSEITFARLREHLDFGKGVKFNAENMDKRTKLLGNTVEAALVQAFGERWDTMDVAEKIRLRQEIVGNGADARIEAIVARYGESARSLLSARHKDGHIAFGREASIRLTALMECGFDEYTAIREDRLIRAFGERWERLPEEEKKSLRWDVDQPEFYDDLSLDGFAQRYSLSPEQVKIVTGELRKREDELPPVVGILKAVDNHAVLRTLSELRKVLNALIGKYGRLPDEMVIELARDLRVGVEARDEIIRRQNKNEKERNTIKKKLVDDGITPSGINILKKQLWEEQGGLCPYSSRSIAETDLFTGIVDIDHILPISKYLDDSRANKVICFSEENRHKGDKTPYEWLYATNRAKFDGMVQTVRKMKKMHDDKKDRFSDSDPKPDEFLARSLNDTAYLSKAAVRYVGLLYEPSERLRRVRVSRGGWTAKLRREWGLEQGILLKLDEFVTYKDGREEEDKPDEAEGEATATEEGPAPSRKDRHDHRHHAVDAIVLALTDNAQLRQLGEVLDKREVGRVSSRAEPLPAPWEQSTDIDRDRERFRQEVKQAVDKIVVSRRAERKIKGALHKETLLSPKRHAVPGGKGGKTKYVLHKRVSTQRFAAKGTLAMAVSKIADYTIREKIVPAWLAIPAEQRPPFPAYPNGVPIRRVLVVGDIPSAPVPLFKEKLDERFETTDSEADAAVTEIRTDRESGKRPYGLAESAGQHHIDIVIQTDAKGRKKMRFRAVTMLEAARRARKLKKPIVDKKPEGYEFVASLAKGEAVLIEKDGKDFLCIVQSISGTSEPGATCDIRFRHHNDGRKKIAGQEFLRIRSADGVAECKFRKVRLSPLGHPTDDVDIAAAVPK